jgi:predicted ATPase
MRTQKQIELDSLQLHISNAYQIAEYLDLDQIANLLKNAFNLTRNGDVK